MFETANINKIADEIKALHASLKEKLPNNLLDRAKYLLNRDLIIEVESGINIDKNRFPVLADFDSNLTFPAIVFAENDIRIWDKAKTFDLWMEFTDQSYYIKGFAPPVPEDKYQRKLYVLELVKHLRSLIDMYTFDSYSPFSVFVITSSRSKP
jgi:hypothetical protein